MTRRYQDEFGLTFGISFALTLLVVSVLFAGAEREEISGGMFVAFFVGGLAIAVPTFFKAVIIAAIIFFSIYVLSSILIGKRAAFVCAAVTAGYISARFALQINLNLFPPNIVLEERSAEFASIVGMVAATVSAVVATVQMMTSNANE